MRSTGSVEQPIELTLRVDLLIHTFGFTFTCGYFGADATSSPPVTLATALHRLQPAQGSASTTPTSWRARQDGCGTAVNSLKVKSWFDE